MVTIEKVRAGVEFTPEAANAFRRAEAQVQREFKRNISVNSTYRSWDHQMLMFINWNKYVNGTGPYPGHSKAIHPKYSRHTNGTALDSNDWRNARIRQILAENGFIRNQLHVPNEEHHFEYIRSEDKNYGESANNTPDLGEEDEEDMKDKYAYTTIDGKQINAIYNTVSGYFQRFQSADGRYNSAKAQGHEITVTFRVTESDFASIESACAAVRARK